MVEYNEEAVSYRRVHNVSPKLARLLDRSLMGISVFLI